MRRLGTLKGRKQLPGGLSGEIIRKGLHLWGSAEGIKGHFVQAP